MLFSRRSILFAVLPAVIAVTTLSGPAAGAGAAVPNPLRPTGVVPGARAARPSGAITAVVVKSWTNCGSNAFWDVTSGSNGSCGGSYLCTGAVGYDGPTGLGTPNGITAF